MAFFVLAIVVATAVADISVHCLYDNIVGDWTFYTTKPLIANQRDLKERVFLWCNKTVSSPVLQNAFQNELNVRIETPNKAYLFNDNGVITAKGTWTMIYDQGFEVIIAGKKFFAFNKFKVRQNGRYVTSYCAKTQKGWYHDVDGDSNYGCYYGVKKNASKNDTRTTYVVNNVLNETGDKKFKNEHDLVKKINAEQTHWRATVYPEYETMTVREMLSRSGPARKSLPNNNFYGALRDSIFANNAERDQTELPTHWDWRNVSGINYDSPVRHQMACGSCYVFATVSAIESRIRIATKNKVQVQLSPQDIVSCSLYSQLCHGGFPYLAAKYVQDFYLVPEDCFPYQGSSVSCDLKCTNASLKVRVANYSYIGGFYGGTNEEAMRREIYNNGPIPVSFVVYPDFSYYRDGVYSHVKGIAGKPLENGGINPWEPVSHSVTIVGWGEENNITYWIVKNSWGKSFGINGYFKIRRGTDECSIESEAISLTPVIEYNH